MIVLADPLPVMVRLSLTSRSPDAAEFSLPPPLVMLSVKVPFRSNTIVSAPALALDSMIASRRLEQSDAPATGGVQATVLSGNPVTWYVTVAIGKTIFG